jgi:Bifunctional DNA primase/polymerase, N-terminal/AAA domain/Primase C terminal 1 (PriCT-1)/FaeA-like protein
MIEQALSYARRGIPVFRVGPDKRPLESNGFHDATTDPEEIRTRWEATPNAGIGAPTGRATFVVIDVDPRHGGDDSLHDLERRHGELPPTPRSVTPSGGYHYLFAAPSEEVRNTAGHPAPGLDVRGDGGYIVVPPSPGPNGRGYEWDVALDERPPAPMPRWLLDAIQRRNGGPSDVPHKLPEGKIPHGQQHHHLCSLAGTLRRRNVGEQAIAAMLIAENREHLEKPGTDEEMRKLARSAMRWDPDSEVAFEDFLLADDGNLPTLPFMTVAEAMKAVPDEPEWFAKPWLAPGVSTLGFAPYKCGKSSLVWGYLRAVERGDVVFLGQPVSGGFSCLFLTEEGPFTIRDKVFDLQLAGEDVEILYRRDVRGVSWEQVWRAAIQRCKEKGHRALVLDTVSTWCGLEGESENHSGAVNAAVAPFKEAAEEAGVALLLLHHARKSGGTHGQAVRGSSQFLALVDTYWELSFLGEDKFCPRKLSVTSRFADDTEPVAYTYVDGEFDHTDDVEGATESKTSRRSDVLEAVKLGARTAEEVAESTGASVYTCRKHLNALHKRGKITRAGTGTGDSPYRFAVAS